MGCAVGASETTDTSSSQLARRRTLTQLRSPSASSVKLKGAMLKMNSACIIIQCAAIDPHLFNDGGRIGGNEFRVRLDEVPTCGGLGHLLRRPVRQSTRLRLQQQLLRQFI